MKRETIFLVSVTVTSLASLYIVWPFLDAILWAGFTAYFLLYFADRLDDKVHDRRITNSILFLILAGFVGLVSYVLLTSVPDIVSFMSQFSDILAGSISLVIDVFDLSPALASSLRNLISQVTAEFRALILGILGQIPSLLINLLIYFVVAAFLIRDGKTFAEIGRRSVADLPPYYRDAVSGVIASVDELFRGVFLSYFLVALATGTLATIGFYLLGLDFFLGWGLLIAIVAFFPIVSAPLVYGPLTLLYLAIGEFWQGILILVYGILFLNILPEALFRPWLAAHTTREHPLLLFVGFLAGPLVLGFKGIILGPIILVVAKNMITLRYFPPQEE